MPDAEVIRSKMRAGTLPVSPEHHLYGSSGEGSVCVCCDRSIKPSELAFEVQCSLGAAAKVVLSMHLLCYEAWVAEVRKSAAS
jgi:hypothetical protein